jgi:hypothetical protein
MRRQRGTGGRFVAQKDDEKPDDVGPSHAHHRLGELDLEKKDSIRPDLGALGTAKAPGVPVVTVPAVPPHLQLPHGPTQLLTNMLRNTYDG